MIKLEIDVEPPAGSTFDTKFLSFPLDYAIDIEDLRSNFANKLHAILCRKYDKGRDCYDFLWYINQQTKPNFELKKNAINQQGPWARKNLEVDAPWLIKTLEDKIKIVDWAQAAKDVVPFLRGPDKNALNLWSEGFFLDKLANLP